MSLDAIELEAWCALEEAVSKASSAFRYLTLCSVDAMDIPQARIVVLRSTKKAKRRLEFHTDTRSAKWVEFTGNNNATVLGYCPEQRLQLRFCGTIARHDTNSVAAKNAWNRLPPWTRATYKGGPPGDELALGRGQSAQVDGASTQNAGREHFGVLSFTAISLDWFQLNRESNKRAKFVYDSDGNLDSRQWINP